MYYLIYISTAVDLLSADELSGLLTVSRKNNIANNLTGMLLYADGTFIQVLEGDEDDINLTFYIISKDTRHKNIIQLISGPLQKRVFPEWSMAFSTVKPEKFKELEGYINPHGVLFKDNETHPIITVLRTFLENNPTANLRS